MNSLQVVSHQPNACKKVFSDVFVNFAQQQDVTVVDEGQRLAFSEHLLWWPTSLTGEARSE